MTRAVSTVKTFSASVPTAAISPRARWMPACASTSSRLASASTAEPAALDRLAHALGIALDDDERHALLMQFRGDDAADAAVAAEDEVIFDVFEHTSDAPLLEAPMQPALHNDGCQQRRGVERRSDTAEDQQRP